MTVLTGTHKTDFNKLQKRLRRNVGTAIVVNTVILAAGFLVMTTSAFKMNVDLGLMTVLAIVFALILDFLFLPALLLLGKRNREPAEAGQLELQAATS